MSGLSLTEAQWTALGVSRESRARIESFVALTLTWQARINLIAPSTIPDIWTRHVLDSLQLLPHIPKAAKTFADLGSGSGFPGLPLAIASGAHVHLYESNGKKAAFLREALRHTNTIGKVHLMRLEDIGPNPPQVDFVTARALAPLPLLLQLAKPFLDRKVTCFFHKGQDVDAELTQAAKSWRIKARTHRSSTDSRAVILQIEEAIHV
jgi:16S rRNA (guanine527-N7)-methyltransferase